MGSRTIKKQYPAHRDDIGPLITRRPVPGPGLKQIDPFLFLNHHGPQVYPENNSGLPFEPHPHRGFETLTFVVKGELVHRDSAGYESKIEAGGIQWMTAGKGIVHSETSSPNFKKEGGEIEILQLWINLPAKLKMSQPAYVGLQKNEIPNFSLDDNKVNMCLIAGHWQNEEGPVKSITEIGMMTIAFSAGGKGIFSISVERNVFLYVVRGQLLVNNQDVAEYHLVDFEQDGEEILIEAKSDALILLGHGIPCAEPMVAHGPFVMNTNEEIIEAIRDYQAGKFE